ncbi:DUF2784 domain-containing protein [Nitrosovibrio tenuis]|uniref:DUF2784 domain-containing protein n=1 Tax=Nitrosovibrio tenuis TaxID=1233 RepID=A0A1H7LCZ8_9PROT|nr:DUF2784 domain-containing protein [Nitrosovibrio tenuis]SEK96726.1 Protein of Unknown function [Nitrosovibrio tenuis]
MPLADFILVVHFLFALFVVGGLPVIWIGTWMGFGFVRNPRFRLAHLVAILFVAGESLIGMVCPLTTLEDALRGAETSNSFVQRWLHRILYYDFPEWALTAAYVLFALLVALTYVLLPPLHRKSRR